MGPETILNDRYRMIELIGRSSFGAVWRCHDLRIGRDVAIKVMSEQNPDPNAFERFRNEARFVRRPRKSSRYHRGV